MKKAVRRIALLLVFVLIAGISFAGCGSSKEANQTGSDTAVSTQSSGTEKASVVPEERIKLRMFMGDSGLPHPQGVDPSNNEFINIVEDYANVDLEMEVPKYEDFNTKFSLMLSSGDMPDIVHTWLNDDAIKAGDSGAFIDLKSYYDKSSVVQNIITPQMMEFAKSDSGHYYKIPMAWNTAPAGGGVYARYDLLQKYNGGVYPTTVDEWVAYLEKLKKEVPDIVPITCHNDSEKIFLYGQTFFTWYGAEPNKFRMQDGKYISTFILPEYRAAVELFKKLYKEGILDKEFATNNQEKRTQRIINNNTALLNDTADQVIPIAQYYASQVKETANYSFAYCPALTEYPSVLKDPKYTYAGLGLPINTGHGVYISSNCKNPDRAWKVIEGFASPEMYDAIFWGKEGSEYVVKDGVKVPDAQKLSDENRSWSLHLAILFGFVAGQDCKNAQAEQVLGTDRFKVVNDSLKIVADQANKVGIGIINNFMPEKLEGVSDKLAESNQFISQATVQAIMGQITMDEFDAKVKAYQTKYGFISDTYTKYINEHKDYMRTNGCISVDW